MTEAALALQATRITKVQECMDAALKMWNLKQENQDYQPALRAFLKLKDEYRAWKLANGIPDDTTWNSWNIAPTVRIPIPEDVKKKIEEHGGIDE